MTAIVYRGVGTVVTGNNATLAPGLPSGLVVGDTLICVAVIRNSGTGVPNQPAGWATLASFGNLAIFVRYYDVGVTAPSVTFTGGVANADTQAAVMGFGNVSLEMLFTPGALVTQLNAITNQNIAYPAVDITPGAAQALLLFAWKQDDSSAITTPSGFTRNVYSSTTTGDDATLAAYYQIQSTETDLSSGTLTVTGGAIAISRFVAIALKQAPIVAATEQTSWPPRVQISVTGLVLGDVLEVYRVVGGQWELVRGSSVVADDPSFVIVDAEQPFGTPVSYAVYVNGVEYDTGNVTYDLLGGNVVLSDAITGAVTEVIIMAAGDEVAERNAARFKVNGRNVVVMGPAGQPTGSYELITLTTSAKQGLDYLLDNATSGIVQIRQPGVSAVTGEPYDGVDAHLAVDRATTRRFSQDGSDPRRLTTIEYAEVSGWALSLEARGFTLQDIYDYVGASADLQDLADVVGPGGTLLDLALFDWSM